MITKTASLAFIGDGNINYSSIETLPGDFDNYPEGTVSAVSIEYTETAKKYDIWCFDQDENFIKKIFRDLN